MTDVAENIKFVLRRLDNMEREVNAGYQHFLLFLHFCLNPLPLIPILGSSNLAANKDMLS